jgi:hypothetical protein
MANRLATGLATLPIEDIEFDLRLFEFRHFDTPLDADARSVLDALERRRDTLLEAARQECVARLE